MKVALLCSLLPPEFEGGTERVVQALGAALVAAGDEVVLVAGSDQPHRGHDVEAGELGGCRVLRLRRMPNEGYGLELLRPRLLAALELLLQREAVDAVHLHHWSHLSLGALRAARRLGITSVATLHDMWVACPRFFRRPPPGIDCPVGPGRDPCGPCLQRDLEVQLPKLRVGIASRDLEIRAELEAAGVVTAPSVACAQAIAAHVPWPAPIEIVPHGLLEPPAAGLVARPRRPFRVGTFGNLVAEKGVATLVEAMAGITGAELHLHGPFLDAGFGREVQASAAAAGITLRCHGPYGVGDSHPADNLDLAVFASECAESYGLVVEEALARGAPVVVSERGALRERIGDGGVVVPAGDVAALRAVIADLARDLGRYTALARGVPAQFSSIVDAAARYRELYRGAGRRAPAGGGAAR